MPLPPSRIPAHDDAAETLRDHLVSSGHADYQKLAVDEVIPRVLHQFDETQEQLWCVSITMANFDVVMSEHRRSSADHVVNQTAEAIREQTRRDDIVARVADRQLLVATLVANSYRAAHGLATRLDGICRSREFDFGVRFEPEIEVVACSSAEGVAALLGRPHVMPGGRVRPAR